MMQDRIQNRFLRSIPFASPHFLLLRELLRAPQAIGAICSSSQKLADRMAACVDGDEDKWVIELGGGTGAITQALLRRGIPANRLIVIEKSARLASHLSRRFPDVRIVQSDAADSTQVITKGMQVRAIVSGLPLRSLAAQAVDDITRAWAEILEEEGRVIQFTYAHYGESPWLRAGLIKAASKTVWANIPPARVEVFTMTPDITMPGTMALHKA